MEIPVGLPSSLLERRPDVREAEQQVRAANAEIGAAIGDFFPRIGLTAFYGGTSTGLKKLCTSGANIWSAAATAAGPVLYRRPINRPLPANQSRLGRNQDPVPANRPQRLPRGVRRAHLPPPIRRRASRANPGRRCWARRCGVGDGALQRRQGQLLRGSRGPAATLPRRKLPVTDRSGAPAHRRSTLRSPRRRLVAQGFRVVQNKRRSRTDEQVLSSYRGEHPIANASLHSLFSQHEK